MAMTETTKLYQVSFGTQAGYDALGTYDEGTLYFTSDTQRIYRGAVLQADALQGKVISAATDAAAFPTTGQQQGVFYVNTATKEVKVWNGTSYIQLTLPITTAFDGDTASDANIPTSKAVADYVAAEFEKYVPEDMVTDVTYTYRAASGEVTEIAPKLNIKKTDDESEAGTDIPLTGVAYAPKWDATEAKLTIPVVGGSEVVIDIGKISLVDSVTYDPTTHKIIFHIEGQDDVEVEISDFISTVTSKDTVTAKTTINNGNEVQVDVIVDPTEGNSLEATEKGLRVDVTDKIDKSVGSAKADEIMVGNASTGIAASGKKVGGETLAATPDANTVATEKAVKAGLDDKIDTDKIVTASWESVNDTQVPSAQLVKTALAAKVDTASVETTLTNDADKIPTAAAVYSAFCWKQF